MTDETPRFVREEPGEELDLDPAVTFLTNPGGHGASHEDRFNFGLYNGAFASGPPQDGVDITPYGGAGSNFMPHWRFVQSSNSNITLSQVRDTQSPSGSNIRFTGDNTGNAADEAYIEQFVPVGGTRAQRMAHTVTAAYVPKVITSGTGTVIVEAQYVTVDGAAISDRVRTSLSFTTAERNVTQWATVTLPTDTATKPTSGQAYHLRVRFIVQRGTIPTNASFQLDLTDIRMDRLPIGRILLMDLASPGTYQPGLLYQSSGTLVLAPDMFSNPALEIGTTGGATLAAGSLQELSLTGGRIALYGGDVTNYDFATLSGAPAANFDPNGNTSQLGVLFVDCGGAARTFTGIDATPTNGMDFIEGQIVALHFTNTGGANVTLTHASATPTSGNRMGLPGLVNRTIPPNGTAWFIYAPTLSAANPWHLLAVAD